MGFAKVVGRRWLVLGSDGVVHGFFSFLFEFLLIEINSYGWDDGGWALIVHDFPSSYIFVALIYRMESHAYNSAFLHKY
jgi:hypothetical protein